MPKRATGSIVEASAPRQFSGNSAALTARSSRLEIESERERASETGIPHRHTENPSSSIENGVSESDLADLKTVRRFLFPILFATAAAVSCTNDFEAFDIGGASGTGGLAGANAGGSGAGSGNTTGGGGTGNSGGLAGGSNTGGSGGGGGAPVGGGGAPVGGGGAPVGGGGAPVGGGGAPVGGGGAPVGGGGAPVGGGGSGGGTTIPDCQTTYGSLNGVSQVCLETDSVCELAFSATTQTCTQICSQGGGVCQGVFNNAPGACGHAQPSTCDNNFFNDGVCVCSRGCGNGPPCPGNQVCNGGQCQSG